MSLSPDPISSGINSVKFIIISVIVVAVLGVLGYLAYTKSKLQTQLAQAQTDIVALTAANENWKTTSEQANAAIAAQAAADKQREEQAAAAIADAQKSADQATKDAAAIMATPLPALPAQNGGIGYCLPDPQCAAAEKLMNSYFGARK